MAQKYVRVVSVMESDKITMHLQQGWEIITAQFCQSPGQSVGGVQVMRYVPHALLGLPVEVAEKMPAATVQEAVAPVVPTAVSVPAPEPEPSTPAPTPSGAPPIGTLVGSKPAPMVAVPSGRGAQVFSAQPGDVSRSSEETVGIRRR